MAKQHVSYDVSFKCSGTKSTEKRFEDYISKSLRFIAVPEYISVFNTCMGVYYVKSLRKHIVSAHPPFLDESSTNAHGRLIGSLRRKAAAAAS